MNVFLGGNIEDVQDNVNIYLTLTNISKYKNINNMYSSFLQEFLDAEKSSEIDIFGVNQPKVEALDVGFEEKEEIEETPDLEEINFEEEEDVDDFQEEEEVEIEEDLEEGYDEDDWVDYGESKEDEWVGEEETEEQDEEEFVDSADWEESQDDEDDEWEIEEESEVVEDDDEWVDEEDLEDEEEVTDEQVEETKESEEVEFEESSDEILGDQDLSKVAKQEEPQIEEKQYLPPLREYVKKNPKVTKSEVIKLYGSKELTKMLKLGKVYERKGRLFI